MTELAAVGDVLAGKYRVDKILGIGGMGMVVAATHLEIDQRVALKFMLPGTTDSADSAARFLREARAAGRLSSDHVCRVMDIGRFDSGVPYIVMEYLQGESLGAVLRRRGPLPVTDAVDFILQAIEGLAEAHAHGIIHRDLKPDNLFLHKRNDGAAIVKVLDFGISKVAATGVSTRTGDVMGSPAYMAPEQMQASRTVDHRADVWSLGVVLYQLIVGRPPFAGDTLPLLCMHVIHHQPKSMAAIRGDLPDGFEEVVLTCLQKHPADRYADVGELAQALAPFGPRNAVTSASRIEIVLRRVAKLESAPAISRELSTVAPTLDYEMPVSTALDRPVPAKGSVYPPARIERGPIAALGATSGESAPLPSDGYPRGLAGAILVGIGLIALAIVMLWRNARSDDAASAEPAMLGDPTPAIRRPAPPVPLAPIVEPITEPVIAPATSAGDPAAAPKPDPKRHKPHRAGVPRASSAGSGSSALDDDDKWMHMTHDEKQR